MRGLSLLSSLLVDIGVYFGEAAPSISLGFFGINFSGPMDFRGLPRGLRTPGDPEGRLASSPSSCELIKGLSLVSPLLMEHFGDDSLFVTDPLAAGLVFTSLPLLGFDVL